MIYVDSREHKVIPYLQNHTVINNMTRGDYVICDTQDKILHVFERKTMSDLVQSMINKTLHIENMLHLREETGCKLAFLIEHKTLFYEPDTMVKGVPYYKLRGLLNTIYIKHDITIVYTCSPEDTAKRLLEYLFIYNKILVTPSQDVPSGGNKDLITQKVPISTETYVKRMWKCLPGVGEETASLLIETYTLKDFWVLDKQELGQLTLNGKRLGTKLDRALELYQSFDKTSWIKILACCPGLSKARATKIVEQHEEGLDLDSLETLLIDGKKAKALGKKLDNLFSHRVQVQPTS